MKSNLALIVALFSLSAFAVHDQHRHEITDLGIPDYEPEFVDAVPEVSQQDSKFDAVFDDQLQKELAAQPEEEDDQEEVDDDEEEAPVATTDDDEYSDIPYVPLAGSQEEADLSDEQEPEFQEPTIIEDYFVPKDDDQVEAAAEAPKMPEKLKLWNLFSSSFGKKDSVSFYKAIYEHAFQVEQYVDQVQKEISSHNEFPAIDDEEYDQKAKNYELYSKSVKLSDIIVKRCEKFMEKAENDLQECEDEKCNRWKLMVQTVSYYWKKSGIERALKRWKEVVNKLKN